MKIPKTRERHRIPAAMLATMLGALALAGCSSGHVGDSWQCPLAEGGACDSVAAADPAVPDAGSARKTLLAEPLWRQRADEPGLPTPEPCEAECGGGFDPFGWIMRLIGGGVEVGPSARAKSPSAADAAPAPETGPGPAEPAAAALPAEPAPGEDDRGGDSLRTGEVVARIWIAPFVDADGVYREATHVRVVLEPAGWSLPR